MKKSNFEAGKWYIVKWDDSWINGGGWLSKKRASVVKAPIYTCGLCMDVDEHQAVFVQSYAPSKDHEDDGVSNIMGIPHRCMDDVLEIEVPKGYETI